MTDHESALKRAHFDSPPYIHPLQIRCGLEKQDVSSAKVSGSTGSTGSRMTASITRFADNKQREEEDDDEDDENEDEGNLD